MSVRRLVQVVGVTALAALALLALRLQSTVGPVLAQQDAKLQAVLASIPPPPGVRPVEMPRAGKGVGYLASVYYEYPGPAADLAPHYNQVLQAGGWTPCRGTAELPLAYMKSIYEVGISIPRASFERVDHNPVFALSVVYRADEDGACPEP